VPATGKDFTMPASGARPRKLSDADLDRVLVLNAKTGA
jgi:hypothetical protein